MVRVFSLCLSAALFIFGTMGVTLGAPAWLIAIDFIVGAVGLGLGWFLWHTQGRSSVIVAFGMATALVVLFFAGLASGASAALSWCIFGVGAAFFAVGCARAFAPAMYGGELEG